MSEIRKRLGLTLAVVALTSLGCSEGTQQLPSVEGFTIPFPSGTDTYHCATSTHKHLELVVTNGDRLNPKSEYVQIVAKPQYGLEGFGGPGARVDERPMEIRGKGSQAKVGVNKAGVDSIEAQLGFDGFVTIRINPFASCFNDFNTARNAARDQR